MTLGFVTSCPTPHRLLHARHPLVQFGNEREDRYLIVACTVITDVLGAVGPLPVALMAKVSLPLYRAFAVYS